MFYCIFLYESEVKCWKKRKEEERKEAETEKIRATKYEIRVTELQLQDTGYEIRANILHNYFKYTTIYLR